MSPTFLPFLRSMQVTVQIEDPLVSLARDATRGDPDALGELLRELRPLVVRTARLIVGSGSWAAEDAAQDALLDVLHGLPALRTPEAVRAWALRVTTTRALKVARRERLLSLRRRALAQPETQEQEPEPLDRRAAALKEAFDQLPPKLRATAVLRLYSGLDEAETAAVLGCSLGTVKSNLHDARKRLAASLAEADLAPTVALHSVEEIA